MLIFNSDGSRAEMCMNGCCSAAHFLFFFRRFGSCFNLKIGRRQVKCSIINENKEIKVLSTHAPADYKEAAEIKTTQGEFFGHIVNVGNPHFVIFEKCELEWLSFHGREIEQHQRFPRRTNVEFAWLDHKADKPFYNLLVYERGCGITLACGSGAAAVLWTLFHEGKIVQNEKASFIMPGGTLVGSIDSDKNIVIEATAKNVFIGELSKSIYSEHKKGKNKNILLKN